MAHNLTTADLDRLERHDDWEGFGYLGERRHAAAKGIDTAAADAKAIAAANAAGMDLEALFVWANNKTGRWYGDCMFGANGSHAEKYLPGTVLR